MESKKNRIIEEAFEIPESILKPIQDYYVASYAQYKRMPAGTKITNKNFPPKKFKLDFTDTNYEKLNSLNPVIVVYFNNNENDAYFSSGNKKNKITIDKGVGHMHLSFRGGLVPYYSTIEHEVMHFVQFLFEKYVQNGRIGGLPSYKIIPDVADSNDQSLLHSARPIEFYPNLISSIRDLQREYADTESEKKGISKKKFFTLFLNNAEDRSLKSLASKIFSEVKEDNPQLYKKYIQIAYKLFVDSSSAPFSMETLRAARKEINNIIMQSQRNS